MRNVIKGCYNYVHFLNKGNIMTDRVRILRIIKYEGSRKWVERTLKKAIHGVKVILNPNGEEYTISAQTLDIFPEIIETLVIKNKEKSDNTWANLGNFHRKLEKGRIDYKPVCDAIGYKDIE